MGPFQLEIFYDFRCPEVSNSLNFWKQQTGDPAETTCHVGRMEMKSFIFVDTLHVAFVRVCGVFQLLVSIHTFKTLKQNFVLVI